MNEEYQRMLNVRFNNEHLQRVLEHRKVHKYEWSARELMRLTDNNRIHTVCVPEHYAKS